MDGGRCFVDVAMRLNTLLKPLSLSLSIFIILSWIIGLGNTKGM